MTNQIETIMSLADAYAKAFFMQAIEHTGSGNAVLLGPPQERDTLKQALEAALKEPKQAEPACGACHGSGRVVRDPDIGTDQECFVCDGSGVFDDAPPRREPLTEKQIIDIDEEVMKAPRNYCIKFARAIEAAHGITGGKE